MKVSAPCPACLVVARFDSDAPPAELSCACGQVRPVSVSESIRAKRVVDLCSLCGSGHFYVEKDFNSWIGLGVMTAAIVGFVWAIRFNWFIAMGFLGGAALLDFAAYRLTGARTICYRCLASYHGTTHNPDHGPYDLGIAGRFSDDYEERRERGG